MQTQWTSWVKDNLAPGSTILELGSGDSTYGLIKEGHIVYSIEETNLICPGKVIVLASLDFTSRANQNRLGLCRIRHLPLFARLALFVLR